MKRRTSIFVTLAVIVSVFLLPFYVQAQTYKGIDVYEYDNISNYTQLKAGGTDVIIQKASQGLYHNDSLLQYRYTHALQYGFKIGFYHFADNNLTNDAVQQAQHFISQIKGLHSDTVYFLDIEQPDPLHGIEWTKPQAVSFTNTFINYMQGQGYKCGVYTNQALFYEYLAGNIPNVPVWLANYSRQPAQFPDVVSWQYSPSGRIAGVTGDVDLDYFNDSIFLGQTPIITNAVPVQKPQPQFWGGYNVDRVRSLQHLINGLGLANLSEDGQLGNQTLSAMQKLPIAKLKGYHNDAYTDWIESQLGQTPDHVFGYGMDRITKSFQSQHGLTADGGVGIYTLKEILRQP